MYSICYGSGRTYKGICYHESGPKYSLHMHPIIILQHKIYPTLTQNRSFLLQEIVHYPPLQSEPDHRDIFINIMTSKIQMILNALGKFVY